MKRNSKVIIYVDNQRFCASQTDSSSSDVKRDELVYQLYGLTEEVEGIIEGRG